jgi:hypothetical protein
LLLYAATANATLHLSDAFFLDHTQVHPNRHFSGGRIVIRICDRHKVLQISAQRRGPRSDDFPMDSFLLHRAGIDQRGTRVLPAKTDEHTTWTDKF